MSAPSKSIFRKFRRSLLYLAVVFAICVGGYHVYGWDLVDSVYMVVITMFGVGYGEVHPLDDAGKIFTMFVIVAGTSAVVFVIGEVIRFITEGEIMKAIGELKKSKQVEGISAHAIICGYGRIGQILAHELAAAKFPFVVVDLDDARLALAEESGYLFVKGSATERDSIGLETDWFPSPFNGQSFQSGDFRVIGRQQPTATIAEHGASCRSWTGSARLNLFSGGLSASSPRMGLSARRLVGPHHNLIMKA